jgi:hypothetical protein
LTLLWIFAYLQQIVRQEVLLGVIYLSHTYSLFSLSVVYRALSQKQGEETTRKWCLGKPYGGASAQKHNGKKLQIGAFHARGMTNSKVKWRCSTKNDKEIVPLDEEEADSRIGGSQVM